MNRRQVVFFDLGWTLEDETHAQLERATRAAEAAREFGVDTTADRILALQEKSAAEQDADVYGCALQNIGLDESQIAAVRQKAGWDKSLLCLFPSSREVLTKLRERHVIGLIANQSAGTVARLRKYGIYGCFDILLASDETGIEKPDPRIFTFALERSGCAASDAWMIGDRIDNDIKPAKALGWKTIRILQGYSAFAQPKGVEEEADYTVRELLEVMPIFT